MITTQTEHKCVLDSCRALESEGFRVTYLPVQNNGIIRLDELEKAMTPDTSLVSIMTVNNEIGVKQPITAIGELCKSKNVFLHTDAAQAVGKVPIDVNKSNISLMSISGHKLYGPKGIGALFVRRRPRVRVEALQSGGGQERGIFKKFGILVEIIKFKFTKNQLFCRPKIWNSSSSIMCWIGSSL